MALSVVSHVCPRFVHILLPLSQWVGIQRTHHHQQQQRSSIELKRHPCVHLPHGHIKVCVQV